MNRQNKKSLLQCGKTRFTHPIACQRYSSLNDERTGGSQKFGYGAQLCTNAKMMARFMNIDSAYVSCY
jgi:hypothetical protein